MNQHLTQYTQIRAVLAAAASLDACCTIPGALDVLLSGDVRQVASHEFETTGLCVGVDAICTGAGKNGPHAVDAVTWHVSPEGGGSFQKFDTGMHFHARAAGHYEIWAQATEDILSPRTRLVVHVPLDQATTAASAGSCRGADTFLNRPQAT